jgi:hypothetical protein
MSFRLFIYYCAAWGGAAAFAGWMAGRIIEGDSSSLGGAALKGLCVGALVALGLGLLDALAGSSRRDTVHLLLRLAIAISIGSVGGLIGGFLGQVLYQYAAQWSVFVIFGWTLTGVLIGAAPAIFDFLSALLRNQDRRGALRKLRNGLIGGAIGGLLGGIVSVMGHGMWSSVFKDADAQDLWSPSATGFVALGACIGLSVALAQIILREASLRVEAGFRPGRQVLLTQPETTIGRAESCDVGLFGDGAVEKLHARITRQGDRWLLADAGTATGTLLNGVPLLGPSYLNPGDRIQVGGSVLSFAVRTKESAAMPVVVPVEPTSMV